MYDYESNDERGIKEKHSIKKTLCHSEANNLFFCPKIGSHPNFVLNRRPQKVHGDLPEREAPQIFDFGFQVKSIKIQVLIHRV